MSGQVGLGQLATSFPTFTQDLMNSGVGTIARRFPTFWNDGEGGIDWSVPQGTPVVALADGVIAGAGYFCLGSGQLFLQNDGCSGGVVTTRVTNQDGTQTDLYYQHITLNSAIIPCDKGIASCQGQTVKKGQVIGYIRNFGMIEMGVNVGNSPNPPPYPTGWGGIWGADPSPGPHVDPEAYLRALIGGQNTTGTIAGAGLVGGGQAGGLGDISAITDVFTKLGPWLSHPVRILKLVVGVLLMGISIYMLIDPEVASKVSTFIKNNPEVLAA